MRIVAAIAAIVTCLVVPLTTPAATGPALPAGTVGYAWVPNVDKLFADADQFLTALGAPNMFLMMAKAGLGQMLGNAELNAVDLKGPLAIVVLNPKENPQPLAAAFRLKAADAYFKGMEEPPTLIPGDEKSGVRIYSRKISTFDSAAYDAASPDEQSDVNRFYQSSEQPFLALQGDTAWISENPALLDQVKGISLASLAAPLAHDLVLVFETETLGKLLREEADQQLEKTDKSGTAGGSAQMLRSQVDLYLNYLGQVKQAVTGLTLDKNGVAVEKIVMARPGSTLASFLAAQKKGELKLARFLDRDSWFAADFRVSRPEMLLGFYSRMFDLMAEASPLAAGGEKTALDPKARGLYLKAIKAMVDAMGEESAFSVSSPPGTLFSGVSVMEIKSEEAWRGYIRQGMLDAMLPAWKSAAAKKGMTYDASGIEQPGKYKNFDVYTLRVRIDKSALAIPEEAMKEIGGWVNQTMTVAMAAAGKIAVSAMSWGGEPRIGEVLDRVAAGQSSFDPARFGAAAAGANGAMIFSLDSFLRGILGIIPADKIEGLQGENLKKLSSLELPLIVSFRAEGETLRASSSFPMEKILAVKNLFESKSKPAPETAPEKPMEPAAE
jgi:hypothetical protein